MTCLLLVACSKNNGQKDSDPTLFREYITGFSAGTIPANGPIEVILTEALSEDKIKDLDTSKLFEFSPAVEGKVIFEGSLLKFVPNESLEHNKEYAVTLHLDKLFEVKKDLKSFFFHVRTQSLLFEVNIRDLQSYSRDYYFLNAYLEASDNISPKILPELISASIDGEKLRIKPQATESSTLGCLWFYTKVLPINSSGNQLREHLRGDVVAGFQISIEEIIVSAIGL